MINHIVHIKITMTTIVEHNVKLWSRIWIMLNDYNIKHYVGYTDILVKLIDSGAWKEEEVFPTDLFPPIEEEEEEEES